MTYSVKCATSIIGLVATVMRHFPAISPSMQLFTSLSLNFLQRCMHVCVCVSQSPCVRMSKIVSHKKKNFLNRKSLYSHDKSYRSIKGILLPSDSVACDKLLCVCMLVPLGFQLCSNLPSICLLPVWTVSQPCLPKRCACACVCVCVCVCVSEHLLFNLRHGSSYQVSGFFLT